MPEKSLRRVEADVPEALIVQTASQKFTDDGESEGEHDDGCQRTGRGYCVTRSDKGEDSGEDHCGSEQDQTDQEIVTLHHTVGDFLGRLVPVGEIGDVDGIRDQEDHPR